MFILIDNLIINTRNIDYISYSPGGTTNNDEPPQIQIVISGKGRLSYMITLIYKDGIGAMIDSDLVRDGVNHAKKKINISGFSEYVVSSAVNDIRMFKRG